ncbi:hypothetical protein [Enterococcus olivae]
MKKWRIGLYLGISFLLIIIAGSIGQSIGWNKSIEKQEKEQKLSDSFSDQYINDFLTVFYTFDYSGDNFADYRSFLTRDKAKKEQRLLETMDTKPQQFGHVQFKTSQNYIQLVNAQSIETISFVDLTMDLLNNEGQVVTRDIENQIVLKIHYVFDEEANSYLIDAWEQLTIR